MKTLHGFWKLNLDELPTRQAAAFHAEEHYTTISKLNTLRLFAFASGPQD